MGWWLILWGVGLAQAQDRVVYDDALAPGWQDWSWSAAIDFASPVARSGVGIEVSTQAWGGLSLYHPTHFGTQGALRFWMEGDAPQVDLVIESVGEGTSAPAIDIASVATVVPGAFTEVVVDLAPLGNHAWDRISWIDRSGAGSSFHLDDVDLPENAPVETTWTAAEPVGSHHVVLQGGGDPNTVTVSQNGVGLGVLGDTPASDPQRTYLTLDRALVAGSLVITTDDGTFNRTVRAETVPIGTASTHRISPWIYGVAFPPDVAWVDTHGVRVARWGGNATTSYNPFLDVTNAGVDWYFENRASGPADAWITWLRDRGVFTWMSVPALDWVARDASSYSYAVSIYGPQQDVNPFNADAGNGVLTDGTPITWNDPGEAHTPWSPADAEAWLASLPVPATFASVDNELDITSDTHRDVHPDPLGYDELLTRFTDHAAAMRSAQPGTVVAAPSSCCWWFFWNSMIGQADKDAHGGVDLLPWFLQQVAAADAQAGARSLDMLDIHYYPDGVFNDQVDPATRARRLRSTRSLWDPTYTDEGWIGVDVWATQTQPNPNEVQLVPRFQALLDLEYPGTLLGLTEWNFGAEGDNSGGLAVADVLGIFGREDLDLATHWTTPAAGTPAAAGFWLYGSPDLPFGRRALPSPIVDPDRLGVYAALDDAGRLTVVVVNKDPAEDVVVDLSLPAGLYRVRHFGGAAEGARQSLSLSAGDTVTVPAYGAVFLGQEASPYALRLATSLPVAGQIQSLTATGASPGESVEFVQADDLGAGPCLPPLGGLCLAVQGNVTWLGSAVADGSGTAVFQQTLPAGLGLRDLAFQAVVVRGVGGVDSLGSHAVLETVVP